MCIKYQNYLLSKNCDKTYYLRIKCSVLIMYKGIDLHTITHVILFKSVKYKGIFYRHLRLINLLKP